MHQSVRHVGARSLTLPFRQGTARSADNINAEYCNKDKLDLCMTLLAASLQIFTNTTIVFRRLSGQSQQLLSHSYLTRPHLTLSIHLHLSHLISSLPRYRFPCAEFAIA